MEHKGVLFTLDKTKETIYKYSKLSVYLIGRDITNIFKKCISTD